MELQLTKELSSTQQNTAQNTATICPRLATKTALPRQYKHNKSTKNRNNKNGRFKLALCMLTVIKQNQTASHSCGEIVNFAAT